MEEPGYFVIELRLYSSERRKSYTPRMAWRWVNHGVIFIFGWTIPLMEVFIWYPSVINANIKQHSTTSVMWCISKWKDIQQEKINTGKNILSNEKWLAHEKEVPDPSTKFIVDCRRLLSSWNATLSHFWKGFLTKKWRLKVKFTLESISMETLTMFFFNPFCYYVHANKCLNTTLSIKTISKISGRLNYLHYLTLINSLCSQHARSKVLSEVKYCDKTLQRCFL